MVSKKVDTTETKKVSTKAKTTTKVKSKASAKTSAKETTAPVDVLEQVLEIKAKNDEKKKAKKTSKAASVKLTETPAEVVKGDKIVSNNTSRSVVKENAQKVGARKFKEMKEDVEKGLSDTFFCADDVRPAGIFRAWARAYKNIFNFKGRTSRYELWSFMLVNFIFAIILNATIWANENISPTVVIYSFVFIAILFFVAYLSLFVRRIHDTGRAAFKGFYRPTLVWFILLILSTLLIEDMGPRISADDELFAPDIVTYTILALGYFAICCIFTYYAIKTFITAAFFEEDLSVNQYGAPAFTDECAKNKALRYASIYLVLFLISLAHQLLKVQFMIN